MLDVPLEVRGHVADVLDLGEVRVAVRHRDDLLVAVAAVDHVEDADHARVDQAAREGGLVDRDQDIEGVTVLRQRPRDEAVVARVDVRRREVPIQADQARFLVHLVLVARPLGDLDERPDHPRAVRASAEAGESGVEGQIASFLGHGVS